MVSMNHGIQNGQKAEEYTYVNGVRHGKYELWDIDGKSSIKFNYVNGVI